MNVMDIRFHCEHLQKVLDLPDADLLLYIKRLCKGSKKRILPPGLGEPRDILREPSRVVVSFSAEKGQQVRIHFVPGPAAMRRW